MDVIAEPGMAVGVDICVPTGVCVGAGECAGVGEGVRVAVRVDLATGRLWESASV